MNLSELRAWIDLQSLAPYEPTLIDGYINQAYLTLAAMPGVEWPWLQTTGTINHEAGTAGYDLPTDLNRLQAVIYAGEGAQAQPSRTSVESVLLCFGDDVGESDLPAEYYRQGSQLIFVPTPSATQEVTLIYYQRPTALAADEDTPLFDSAFHTYLADRAMALYYESEESFEYADQYAARAFVTLSQMVQFYDVQIPGERLVVGGGIRRPARPPFAGWETSTGI